MRRSRRLQQAAFALLFWALCKAVFMAAMTATWPSRAALAVAYGPDYAEGNLIWLKLGEDVARVGAAGSFRETGTLAVAGLGAISAGFGGLVAGAIMLNAQAYYVGVLLTRTSEPWRLVVFGWPLWEVARAMGLASVLVAAAEPFAHRVLSVPPRWREARDSLIIGILMLVAAYLGQLYLAPWYRLALAPSVFFEPLTL